MTDATGTPINRRTILKGTAAAAGIAAVGAAGLAAGNYWPGGSSRV